VIDVLSSIWRTKEETARRVRQRVGAVLDWAFARDYQTQVASAAIGMGFGPQKGAGGNFAAFPYVEVSTLAERLRSGPESFGRLGLEFLLLTAARAGEVRGAVWNEIDRDART
jgi:integrase